MYAAVRRAVYVEGISEREAARRFGLSRVTVHKMLQFAVPPGYRRQQPVRRPKLDPYLGLIDQIVEEDKQRPKKQRHTAKRVFERLRDEYGYEGGITIVKDYLLTRRLQQQEMFVPLSHPPGDAQVDFGEADIVLAGALERAHYFVLDLPHSDDAFVMAFPAETTEAFCEGHNQAFAYLGGVPRHIVYDNTKLAVARILGDGKRQRTRSFTELQSHYLFTDRFARPRKGNEKGKVEGLVGYTRRNFFVPMPRVNSFEELNQLLRERCRQRRLQRLRGQQETIGQRLQRDRQAFLPLPAAPYEACETIATRVTSLSLVRYRTNDYSVPTAYGHRDVVVKGYVNEVVIGCGSEIIARHARSYEREDFIFEPLHYLALLEHKSNALDQAAPLQGWELPEEFALLRRLLEVRLGKRGKREYIQVLRLLECFAMAVVERAVREALRLQAISFDGVKHLVLCGIEGRPARLDLQHYPHLPETQVAITAASDYLSLLTQPGLASPLAEALCEGGL
jgi:transposase